MTAGMFALRPKAKPGADRQALARRAAVVHSAIIAAGVGLCVVLVLVRWLTLSMI